MGFVAELASAAARRYSSVEKAVEWIEHARDKFTADSDNDDDNEEVEEVDSSAAQHDLSAGASEENLDPSLDPNKVVAFDPQRGLLSHIVDVIRHRLPSISKYCVLCDKTHRFTTAMLRPTVCCREMCVYQFSNLGLGTDSAESVATGPAVIDLLFTLFCKAALSNRAQQILLPFPSVPDPKNPKKLALDPDRPDIGLVKRLASAFPSSKEVIQCPNLADLKDRLTATDPLVFPLLQWVISSNRSHLVHVDPAHQIAAMKTPYQFLLLTAAPEKERIFREGKKKHGSRFAFHGSRGENWHGILRNGLKNMSGTSNQLNGVAHGSGIYFACEAATSFGYSAQKSDSNNSNAAASAVSTGAFLSDVPMVCLALCEIVDDGCINEHGWCWTVQKEDNVMTRFLFAFQQAVPFDSTASTSNADFKKEITRVMSVYSL